MKIPALWVSMTILQLAIHAMIWIIWGHRARSLKLLLLMSNILIPYHQHTGSSGSQTGLISDKYYLRIRSKTGGNCSMSETSPRTESDFAWSFLFNWYSERGSLSRHRWPRFGEKRASLSLQKRKRRKR